MSKSLRKQRTRLWLINPYCYWCGVKTILPSKYWKGPTAPNVATIDHLRPRHHPLRREPAKNQEVRRVLSCFKCNNDRDREELAKLPREYFYEMGQGKPLTMKPLNELKQIEALLLAKEPKRNRDRRRIYSSLVAVRDVIQKKLSEATA
jgi:hypothetical protein